MGPLPPDDITPLVEELRRCQVRLGTPAEEPGDFERVLRLAHDFNNRITVLCLQASLQHAADGAAAIRHVRQRYRS